MNEQDEPKFGKRGSKDKSPPASNVSNQPSDLAISFEGNDDRRSGLGYYLLALALVVVAGIGGFWLPNGHFAELLFGRVKHPSVLASKCEAGWIVRARNDSQLMCFLETDTARLCDPDERYYLADIFHRYVVDRDSYETDRAARDIRKAVLR